MFKSMRIIALLLASLCILPDAMAELLPDRLVQETADKVLSQVKAKKKDLEMDNSKIYDLVDQYILPHFNFVKMSRSVLGKHWLKASPEQQTKFVEAFQILLIRTYAVALLNYSDQAIEYLPFRMAPDAKMAVVKTRVSDGNGPPLPVDYLLQTEDDGTWKVVDVKIDGISLVSNYRTSFSEQVRRDGIDGLIAQINNRSSFLAQESGISAVDQPAHGDGEANAADNQQPPLAEPAAHDQAQPHPFEEEGTDKSTGQVTGKQPADEEPDLFPDRTDHRAQAEPETPSVTTPAPKAAVVEPEPTTVPPVEKPAVVKNEAVVVKPEPERPMPQAKPKTDADKVAVEAKAQANKPAVPGSTKPEADKQTAQAQAKTDKAATQGKPKTEADKQAAQAKVDAAGKTPAGKTPPDKGAAPGTATPADKAAGAPNATAQTPPGTAPAPVPAPKKASASNLVF